jgi:hypothetical protein
MRPPAPVAASMARMRRRFCKVCIRRSPLPEGIHHLAEQRDELAPRAHSITSSAATRRVGGTVRPIAFAACRLSTVSNFVGPAPEDLRVWRHAGCGRRRMPVGRRKRNRCCRKEDRQPRRKIGKETAGRRWRAASAMTRSRCRIVVVSGGKTKPPPRMPPTDPMTLSMSVAVSTSWGVTSTLSDCSAALAAVVK